MDTKALFSLTYGVFMVATTTGDKTNGCITNTCIQVANNPTRIAISVINANYTCDLIKESGKFTVSMLDQNCSFETIKHFGMQSGRDVDKMDGLTLPVDVNGVPYMGWHSCAMLSGKVVDSIDLGSHTMFIAEVVDAKVLSGEKPLTYADYHSNVKPKPEKKLEDRKIVGWRCKICKFVYEGAELPKDYLCEICGHDISDFEPIYE